MRRGPRTEVTCLLYPSFMMSKIGTDGKHLPTNSQGFTDRADPLYFRIEIEDRFLSLPADKLTEKLAAELNVLLVELARVVDGTDTSPTARANEWRNSLLVNIVRLIAPERIKTKVPG